MNVIETVDLCKVYQTKKRQTVQALSDLNLQVGQGEIFGFLGPNGAGKSTTIKTLVGLITPTSGHASLCGLPVLDSRSRREVGYLPENPAFYDFLTANEYLSYVGKAFSMDEERIRQESARVLELMELSAAASRPIRGYSKGMVQRLGLAQALLHDPQVYILDEPMSGLDPLGRALVKDVIRDLKQRGRTVFFSTHITADVEVVCDRVGVIVQGKLQAVHAVEDLLENGIEGYFVQAVGCPESAYAGLEASEKGRGIKEIYVPRQQFKQFMERLSLAGGDVELIEPKRKDLEAFFLDLVKRKR